MELLLEPLSYTFFRRVLLASLLVGALCGLIGVYIVLRRMSYIGHGLSHAISGGAVISYLLQVIFYLGAAYGGWRRPYSSMSWLLGASSVWMPPSAS